MSSPEKTDVLIIGGGIAGLSLAALLMSAGLRVVVLDRRGVSHWDAPDAFDQRIYALNPSSVDLLHRIGAWDRLALSRIGLMKEIEVHGDDATTLHFPESTGPLAYIVEEGAVQKALEDELSFRFGECYRKIAEPLELRVERDRIELTTYTNERFEASLIVGADGLHSWVRQAQQWTTTTHDFKQTAVVMNIQAEKAHHDTGRQWFLGGDIIALLPLPDRRLSLVWSTSHEQAESLISGGADVTLSALQGAIPESLGPLTGLNTPRGFPLTDVTVSHLIGPRVALVGDAAHRVHPLAGQGLNLGLGDVSALSEAILQRGPGPDVGDWSVLRRYARTRALPVTLMRQMTRGLHGLFESRLPGVRKLRNVGLLGLEHLPFLKKVLVDHASASHRSAP